jgi:hypothetical protein
VKSVKHLWAFKSVRASAAVPPCDKCCYNWPKIRSANFIDYAFKTARKACKRKPTWEDAATKDYVSEIDIGLFPENPSDDKCTKAMCYDRYAVDLISLYGSAELTLNVARSPRLKKRNREEKAEKIKASKIGRGYLEAFFEQRIADGNEPIGMGSDPMH